MRHGFSDLKKFIRDSNRSVRSDFEDLSIPVNKNNEAVSGRLDSIENKARGHAKEVRDDMRKIRLLAQEANDSAKRALETSASTKREWDVKKISPSYSSVAHPEGNNSSEYRSPKRFNVIVEGLDEDENSDPLEVPLLICLNTAWENQDWLTMMATGRSS